MTESFEYKGIWFLPDKTKDQISGVLKYEPESGILLDLIGAFDKKNSTPEIILGVLENGKCATLLNSFESKRSFNLPEIEIATYISNYIFLGNGHYTDRKDLKFFRASVEYRHLDEWLNNSEGFSIDHNFPEKKIEIKYELPDPIAVRVHNNLKLTVNITAKGPILSMVQKEAVIRQRVSALFDYSKQKGFDDIFEQTIHFQNLLTLFLQRSSHPIEFTLFNKDDQGKPTNETKLYYQITIIEKNPKDLLPMDILVPHGLIKDKFETILKSWYRTEKTLDTCYTPYFSNFYNRNFYASDKFLNVARAIEAFHRDTVGRIDPATSKPYHYRKRVLEVYGQGNRAFNGLLKIKSKNRFVTKVKDFRNDFTHSNPVLSNRSKKYLETHYLTERLTIILTCSILLHHGLTIKEIKNRLNGTRLYTHIKYKMK